MPIVNIENYAALWPILGDWDAELSIASVLDGEQPGLVLADDPEHPHTALIRSSETTLLCGDPENAAFYPEIRKNLDWWTTVMTGSPEWEPALRRCHPNPWLHRYERRQYTADHLVYTDYRAHLPEGMTLEPVTPALLSGDAENVDDIRQWAENWGGAFYSRGAGFVVRQDRILCAWSMTDCRHKNAAAIGLVTDPRFRRRGLGGIVSAACADYWFRHGMERLEWLCVGKNAGSQATAKKLGFRLRRSYWSWAPYPPYENDSDCSPAEWAWWNAFYADAYRAYPARYAWIRRRCEKLTEQKP